MDTLEKRALTVEEFCSCYGIGRTLFYQEVKSGRLQVCKIGRRTLVRVDDAEAWLSASLHEGRLP